MPAESVASPSGSEAPPPGAQTGSSAAAPPQSTTWKSSEGRMTCAAPLSVIHHRRGGTRKSRVRKMSLEDTVAASLRPSRGGRALKWECFRSHPTRPPDWLPVPPALPPCLLVWGLLGECRWGHVWRLTSPPRAVFYRAPFFFSMTLCFLCQAAAFSRVHEGGGQPSLRQSSDGIVGSRGRHSVHGLGGDTQASVAPAWIRQTRIPHESAISSVLAWSGYEANDFVYRRGGGSPGALRTLGPLDSPFTVLTSKATVFMQILAHVALSSLLFSERQNIFGRPSTNQVHFNVFRIAMGVLFALSAFSLAAFPLSTPTGSFDVPTIAFLLIRLAGFITVCQFVMRDDKNTFYKDSHNPPSCTFLVPAMSLSLVDFVPLHITKRLVEHGCVVPGLLSGDDVLAALQMGYIALLFFHVRTAYSWKANAKMIDSLREISGTLNISPL
eukprot:GHVU01026014.1.p1 GENE.GHVU01026014.1~~GHVU01026014.1.p1  ORF type:complete len:441 (+),score=40.22 GHVU01026014.1:126-1448(+)